MYLHIYIYFHFKFIIVLLDFNLRISRAHTEFLASQGCDHLITTVLCLKLSPLDIILRISRHVRFHTEFMASQGRPKE